MKLVKIAVVALAVLATTLPDFADAGCRRRCRRSKCCTTSCCTTGCTTAAPCTTGACPAK